MAPPKEIRPLQFDDFLDSASQDGSQILDVQELLDMQKTAVSTRRRKVEAELRQSHRQGFGNLQRRHDEYMAEYEESLKSAQRPFLEKLAELVNKKKVLETQIEKLLDNLQRSDASVSQQLEACIISRVDALQVKHM
ncbi:hypothetical protein Q7P37_002826 [Cladosporium fusiforme]